MSDEPVEPDDPRARRRRFLEYAFVFLILCVVGPFVGNCARHSGSHGWSTRADLVYLVPDRDDLRLVPGREGPPDGEIGRLMGWNYLHRERGLFFPVYERQLVELRGWPITPEGGSIESYSPDELAALRPKYIAHLQQDRSNWVGAFQGPDINRRTFLWLNLLAEGAILFWGLMPLWLGMRWCVAWVEARFGLPDHFAHCPRCGYNLQHNAEPGCPECGWGRDGDEGATEQP